MPGNREAGLSKTSPRNSTPLVKRLDAEQIADLAARASAGASANSLAGELGVSTSALVRLLRAQGVELKISRVTDLQRRQLVLEYEAGATMVELEAKHSLSHNTVLRALHRGGAKLRSRGRQRSER